MHKVSEQALAEDGPQARGVEAKQRVHACTLCEHKVQTKMEDIAECAKKYAVDFIGLDLKIVTHNFVTAAHQAGFPVFVWTVNNKQDADRMRSLGVNGIFTNYPDKV